VTAPRVNRRSAGRNQIAPRIFATAKARNQETQSGQRGSNRPDGCWTGTIAHDNPSARRFRQQQIGNWTEIIDQIMNELRSVFG